MIPAAILACANLAVPAPVMHHVAMVESSGNPYAIGVVGARLLRQPDNLAEAIATAESLAASGYNFSVGVAQVNRANFTKYGLDDYRKAFSTCDNLQAGSRILADCHARMRGAWDKALSCYYSGDPETGVRDGYVRKVFAALGAASPSAPPSHQPGVASVSTVSVAPHARSSARLEVGSRLRDASLQRIVGRTLPVESGRPSEGTVVVADVPAAPDWGGAGTGAQSSGVETGTSPSDHGGGVPKSRTATGPTISGTADAAGPAASRDAARGLPAIAVADAASAAAGAAAPPRSSRAPADQSKPFVPRVSKALEDTESPAEPVSGVGNEAVASQPALQAPELDAAFVF